MPRPGTITYSGTDAAQKWNIVEDVRKSSRLSTSKMAAKIGLTSGAAYRSWKAKNRIPVEAWQKFQAVRDSLDDAEEIIDVTEQVLALIRDGYSGYLHINGRVEAIEVRGKQYECVVCGKRFATQAGKNQYGDPKYCDEHR